MHAYRKITFLLAGLSLLGLFSCGLGRFQFREVRMDLYPLYPSEQGTNVASGFREVYLEPYRVAICISNRFSLSQTDLRQVQVRSGPDQTCLCFTMKRNRRPDFLKFTTINSNSYIAVIVNGKFQNIAQIRQPVADGTLQFVTSATQSASLGRFLRLFVTSPVDKPAVRQ